MTFHVKIIEDEDSWYTAEVPALKGCVSQGATIDEAKENLKIAIESWMEQYEDKEHIDKTELIDIDI